VDSELFAYLRSQSPIVRVLVAVMTVGVLAVLLWAAGRDAGELVGRARLFCFAGYATFALTMLAVALIDLATGEIPDRITLPGVVVFCALSFARPGTLWYDGLVGAAVGYAIPLAIRAYHRMTDRPEPLGLGVVKLLGAIGAYLGWWGVLVTLFGGAALGLLAVAVRAAARRSEDDGEEPLTAATRLEFGPPLAVAAVSYVVFAPWIRTLLMR
jgi:leader peptidase (prepilin peptidase)/N-methyltransferase